MSTTYQEGAEGAVKDLPSLNITLCQMTHLQIYYQRPIIGCGEVREDTFEFTFLVFSPQFPLLFEEVISVLGKSASDPHFVFPASCLRENFALRFHFLTSFPSLKSCHVSFSSVTKAAPLSSLFLRGWHWAHLPHTAPGLILPASPPPTHAFWASLLLWMSSASLHVSACSSP